MPRYLFKGLDAVSVPGPGPVLRFPYPVSFNDMAVQINTNSMGFYINVEVTLNGDDFRFVSVGMSPNQGGISTPMFSPPFNGGYARLGPVGLMTGIRLNLVFPLESESMTITALLAIDQKD